jgi:hypothetical protein
MSNLKRRIVDREDGCRSWALYGRNGVISWELINRSRGVTYNAIAIHSPCPTPEAQESVNDCPFLEMACHWDGSFLAGEQLGRDWRVAGCDDEVIWRELEQWYGSRFGEKSEVTP